MKIHFLTLLTLLECMYRAGEMEIKTQGRSPLSLELWLVHLMRLQHCDFQTLTGDSGSLSLSMSNTISTSSKDCLLRLHIGFSAWGLAVAYIFCTYTTFNACGPFILWLEHVVGTDRLCWFGSGLQLTTRWQLGWSHTKCILQPSNSATSLHYVCWINHESDEIHHKYCKL